jgi:hypothetical protein
MILRGRTLRRFTHTYCRYCKEDTDTISDGVEGLADHAIFNLFLGVLYERLSSVLDGHVHMLRCVGELVSITEDEMEEGSFEDLSIHQHQQSGKNLVDTKDSNVVTLYTKRDIAVAIQNEVKTLLYGYLTNEDVNINSSIPVLAINEMLKDNKKGGKRVMKAIFHFKSLPGDEVKKAFMEACPLGASFSERRSEDVYGNVDRFTTIIERGHKCLIQTNASNILVAYQPTLDFMLAMERKVGIRLANFKMYLEDFIFNVYLPQIQEQVLVYFHANVNGIDSFQADRTPDAPFPLMKSALCLVLEMNGICRMIQCMPVQAVELVKFVEFTFKKFYEKCCGRFRSRCRW